MEERRKIIIQTGDEPDEALSTPHFDAEATLAARPVVPLAEPVAQVSQHSGPAPRSPLSAPRDGSASAWKRSTLLVIVLFAVSIGVLGGLAIGFYQSRRKAPAQQPVVTAPAIPEPQQATAEPHPEPQQSPREPEPEVQTPVTLPEPEKDKRTEPQSSPDKPERDEAPPEKERRVPPLVVPQEPENDPVAEEREERRARREERRERRREERRRQREEENADSPLDVPRQIERAQQGINRIREIFEGPQQ